MALAVLVGALAGAVFSGFGGTAVKVEQAGATMYQGRAWAVELRPAASLELVAVTLVVARSRRWDKWRFELRSARTERRARWESSSSSGP
jgi:hypothetical protein